MEQFNSFTDLISYIRHNILPEEMNVVNVSFDDYSILMEFYEDQIPIIIEYHKVYDLMMGEEWHIEAELFTELVGRNVSAVELTELGQICELLNNNVEILSKLIIRKE